MTHEQKPESAEFRTREAQASVLMQVICDAGWRPDDAHECALRELSEAEARGAAEQRRKDAEGNRRVGYLHILLMENGQELEDFSTYDESELVFPDLDPLHSVRVEPVYLRPANVAALEARGKELEEESEEMRAALAPFAECAECFDASGNDYERDYPDEFSLGGEDDENVLHCLSVGHLRVARSVYAAAIREGGEHG